MEADRIKTLLDKYYSGDILPNEFHDLQSALSQDTGLSSEMEAEKKTFHAIESYVPKMPEGFEDRLVEAIDRQSMCTRHILKMIISSSVAAMLLICIIIGENRNSNKELSDSKPIAKTINIDKAVNTIEDTEPIKTENVYQVASIEKEGPIISKNNCEDIVKDTQIVDEALLSVLSSIHAAQIEVAESIESIQINQTKDFNI